LAKSWKSSLMSSGPPNSWIHAGLFLNTSRGFFHCFGGTGGANRSGGLAKGIPRNLFTVTVEDGIEVAVPITMPCLTVAEGWFCVGLVHAADAKSRVTSTTPGEIEIIVTILWTRWTRSKDENQEAGSRSEGTSLKYMRVRSG
jgi:hypothetical protein